VRELIAPYIGGEFTANAALQLFIGRAEEAACNRCESDGTVTNLSLHDCW